MFVTFEGVEGAGKSTALKNMARELGQEGVDVLVTREPGGSGLGKALRTLLLDCNSRITPDAELCLFLADRAQHVAEIIRPALAAGKVVLCDRYADSTYAYQGFARGMDLGRLRLLNDAVTGGLRPDLTLVFDVPEEEGLARARARNQSEGTEVSEGRFDSETLKYFIGPPLETSFSVKCGLDSERSREAVGKYREYYSTKGIYELKFFPSTLSALREIKAAGVKTAVGSSKPELFVNRILEHFGISELFDFVSGATFGEPHADKTVIITRAAEGLGIENLSDAVMVGDRSFDIDGAHGVGMKCIGVLEGGYGDENEFKTAGADWIVNTLADAKDIILK